MITVHLFEDVIDISANIYAAYALTRDGSIYAWGRNYYAALGQGTGSDYYQYYPIKVKSTDGNGFFGAGLSNKAVKIRAGVHSAIVIMDDGTAYAWGYNNYGNLGLQTVQIIHYRIRLSVLIMHLMQKLVLIQQQF